MAHETLRIELGGKEIPALYEDLLSLEVSLDEELAGTFQFAVALTQLPDGSFRHLDEDYLAPWQEIAITGGPAGAARLLISGFITHVEPQFAGRPEDCTVQVSGMDRTAPMDRADVIKDWPANRDSTIARAVLQSYGLTPMVTETPVIHDPDVSTIIQRETDMQFLRRLAKRNGYECYVDGKTGWFGPQRVTPATVLPVLAVLFGPETNVLRFDLDVDAHAPSDVAMTQVDRMNKSVLTATVPDSTQPALGARQIADYLPAGVPRGTVIVGQVAVTGRPELNALAAALRDEGSWFVTGDGEVDGNDYHAALMPRATIIVKGVGQTHSGAYVVTRVSHQFTHDGYQQTFGVKRNALRTLGTEDFVSADATLPVSLAAAAVLAELTT